MGVAVLTFSSLVFYAEKDSKEFSWTFIDSFWWGLMTLTTGKIQIPKNPLRTIWGECAKIMKILGNFSSKVHYLSKIF